MANPHEHQNLLHNLKGQNTIGLSDSYKRQYHKMIQNIKWLKHYLENGDDLVVN